MLRDDQVLEFGGKTLRVVPDYFIGSVDNAGLTKTGVQFTCWAVTNPKGASGASPPAQFLVRSRGVFIAALEPNTRRRDIAQKFGDRAAYSGLTLDVELDQIPKPLDPDFEFFAFDGETTVTCLSYFARTNRLAEVKIKSASDFMRLIQTPSTRIKDAQTLLFGSILGLKLFPRDYNICAGAVCVIGYRIVENEVIDGDIKALFARESERLLQSKPDIPKGLYLRWHTSLRLVSGYVAYQSGDRETATGHFEAIAPFFIDLRHWPQALTNLLLGVYISGYLKLEAGNAAAATHLWGQAEEMFRFGATVAKFDNYYGYGELTNALNVARECHVAMLAVKAGGPIHDVRIAPDGIGLDLDAVPGPIGRLAAEYRAVTGEPDQLAIYKGVRR